MFRLNNLAPGVPLNFSTPPRQHPLLAQQQQTPDSPFPTSPAGKTLNFSATNILSHGSPNAITPKKKWTGLDAHNPIDTTPQRLLSSAMATPESLATSTPEQTKNLSAEKNADSGKRGRPRADVITTLIQEGSSSPSGIKCRICGRVFPREKSLQVIISCQDCATLIQIINSKGFGLISLFFIGSHQNSHWRETLLM